VLQASLSASTADKNAVTVSDAIMILKQLVGLVSFNGYQQAAADFDQDGSVNVNDAIGVLRHVVDLSSAPEPVWEFDPLPVDMAGDDSANLVGVLTGDVNGSWIP